MKIKKVMLKLVSNYVVFDVTFTLKMPSIGYTHALILHLPASSTFFCKMFPNFLFYQLKILKCVCPFSFYMYLLYVNIIYGSRTHVTFQLVVNKTAAEQ